jgi:hypothetical protein
MQLLARSAQTFAQNRGGLLLDSSQSYEPTGRGCTRTMVIRVLGLRQVCVVRISHVLGLLEPAHSINSPCELIHWPEVASKE